MTFLKIYLCSVSHNKNFMYKDFIKKIVLNILNAIGQVMINRSFKKDTVDKSK